MLIHTTSQKQTILWDSKNRPQRFSILGIAQLSIIYCMMLFNFPDLDLPLLCMHIQKVLIELIFHQIHSIAIKQVKPCVDCHYTLSILEVEKMYHTIFEANTNQLLLLYIEQFTSHMLLSSRCDRGIYFKIFHSPYI